MTSYLISDTWRLSYRFHFMHHPVNICFLPVSSGDAYLKLCNFAKTTIGNLFHFDHFLYSKFTHKLIGQFYPCQK